VELFFDSQRMLFRNLERKRDSVAATSVPKIEKSAEPPKEVSDEPIPGSPAVV